MSDLETIYRVQDAEGRGPWRPGFSAKWVRYRPDHELLRPWIEQFGKGILPRIASPVPRHFGCGCRTLEQLRRWIAVDEYAILQHYGYQAVLLEVQAILGESDIQVVFERRWPLSVGGEVVDLYPDLAAGVAA
jgi:hypothetical protein